MKVTTEIELDRDEERELDILGICPLCGQFIKKHESQNSWEDFTMTDDGWKSTARDVNEVDYLRFTCTNNKCEFKYEYPC